MKKVKAFFIVVILVMAIFVLVVLGAAKSFAEAVDDGFMMPSSSSVARALNAGGEGDPVALIEVKGDDMIYTSLGRFYVGEDRRSVDVSYPMWVSGGAGLRFLDDENWLITADVDLLRTFEGLYLTDGVTYNVDRTQADGEEFILLRLQNGLYVNAQRAQFTTKMNTYDIPVNSLLMFSESALRWYFPNGKTLEFDQAEEVFEATLTIGNHEYDYAALLKALGLISDAIGKLEDGQDPTQELNEAATLIGNPGGSNSTGGGQGQGEGVQGEDTENAGQGGSSLTGTTTGNGEGEGEGVIQPDGSVGSGSGQGGDSGKGTGSTGSEFWVPEAPSESGGSGGSGQGEGDASLPETGEGTENPDQSEDETEDGSEGEESPEQPGQPGGSGGIPSEGEEGEPGDGSGSGGSGSGQPIPYQAPVVELLDIKSWSYAVNLRLRLFDPAGTITKGVRITAYKALSSDAEEIGTTEDGYPIWSAKEGRSALTRKSYMSAQTLNLSPLSPDTTFYIQYSYTYIAEETDPETGEEIRIRRTYYSDFIEVTTPTIKEGDIKAVAADWNLLFAQHSDAIQLDSFVLSNTSDYQPEDTSFENFKLNTLPYANRILLQCTPVDEKGDPIPGAEPSEITINSTILGRAQRDGGTSYTSSSPKLESNQRYSIQAVLRDRYGNDLPLQINGEDGSQILTAYTAKQQPTVTIEETANVTDKLTLTVRVSDPDGALAKEGGKTLPLVLSALDTNGQAATLTGTFEDGSAFGDAQSKTLTLSEPADGKEYVFTIDSLAFARTYQFTVTGDYNPQPDGVTDPPLPVEQDVRMGSARIYTASLSSGLVNFSTSIANLLDTSMTLNATMTSNTTLEILPLVDEYRVFITKEGSKEPAMSYVLSMEFLDRDTSEGIEDGSWYYDEEQGALVLQTGDALNPTVMLVGDRSLFTTNTPWEALSPKIVNPDAEKIEYTIPARLRIDVPPVLQTSTRYNVEIRSMVIKGGEEYQIPTTLSTSAFTTKKIQPKLQYTDLFAAGDLLSLINTRIYDPDGTIQQDGLVYVYLYYNGTLLDMQRVYATTSENGPTQTITFDGIIEGAQYDLQFVAAAFNDAEGFSSYQDNYLLWSYVVEGGSSLNGNINVDSIEYASTNQARSPVVRLSGEEIRSYLEDGSWKQYSATYPQVYTTHEFEIPEGTTFLQVSDFVPPQELTQTPHFQVLPTFYDSDGKTVKVENYTQDSYIIYGGTPVFAVPEGAVSFTVRIPVTEEGALQWGLQIDGYTTPKNDLFQGMAFEEKQYVNADTGVLVENDSYNTTQLIPVKPGQIYFWTGNDSLGASRGVFFYTQDGGYMGTITGFRNRMITIPEGVGYMRLGLSSSTSYTYQFYLVSDAVQESGYNAVLSLEVNDNNGYLSFGLKEGDTPTATLEVYASESISAPDWKFQQSWRLELWDEDGDNRYQLTPEDASKVLEGLPANQSYQLVLKANYQDNEVTLDTASFQTDGAYFVIRNQRDLLEVNANPFANYLVVEDFEQTISSTVSNVYGTIDFQGHVVTRSGVDNYLISTIQTGGVVRNLVYDYPADSTVTKSMITYNYGTIENVVVRTQGKTTITSGTGSLVLYQNSIGGTLRNFILELNGDLTIATSTWVGGAVRVNYGLVENGYMYGANGAGVMFMTLAGNQQRAGGFMGENYPGGITRNVFTLFDSWYLGGPDSYAGALAYHAYYNFSNAYHVGDFYQYVSDKSTVSPMNKERLFYSSVTASGNRDVYYISSNTYTATTSWITATDPATLYDQQWQQNVLGDGFDTSTIEVGFYPRLELPTVMQKYQNYLPLPVLGDSAPEIISDSWTTGDMELIENEGGNVTFILNNPRNASITSFKAAGLKFAINEQHSLGDGLYEVTAYVSVDPESPQYLSSYTITEIQYTSGASSITAQSNYKTSGFEFWKTVNNAQEWADINDHMNWNYRLTADIDFKASTLIPAAIMINGSKTSLSYTTSFTGKLDGDGHTVSNITLENVSQPWMIYRMTGATCEVMNLTVENLSIKAGGSVTTSRAGFVGNMNNGKLENVHIRNAQISGVGYVGGLVGYVENGLIKECSVADSKVDDGSGAYPARVGGLVGYFYGYMMDRCYTRDVEIQVTSSPVIEGVGGLVGYDARGPITNCYATGSIVTTGGKTGGAVGVISEAHAYTEHVWTDVSINATGDQVGGMGGWITGRHKGGIVFGNILTSGQEANRVNGAVASNSYTGRNILVLAYNKQTVNNLAETEISDARSLVSGTDLSRKSLWADTANMGAAFDYTQLTLTTPGMPLILSEDGDLVEGQEWIELPGQMEPPSLRITEASYTAAYQFAAELQHPGYSSQEIIKLLSTNTAVNGLTIDGIDISEAQQQAGNVAITFNPAPDGAEATTFVVQIKELPGNELFTKRLDTYTLTVAYQTADGRSWSLDATVDFGNILYWEVPNLETWRNLMQGGHAQTGENFKITGQINFNNDTQMVQEVGLKIGRLEGAAADAGFYNLNYTANATTGAPWIESVYTDISNLTFWNFTVDFSNTDIARGVSGVIVSANTMSNCVFEEIEVLGNQNTDARFGFFGQIDGDIENITLNTVKLEVLNASSAGQYVGFLAGQLLGSFRDIEAENVTMEAPKAYYVGGLFGTQTSNIALDSGDVTLKNITVNAGRYAGALSYQIRELENVTLENFSVTASHDAGGLICASYTGAKSNILVKNGTVKTTSNAVGAMYVGGVFAYDSGYTVAMTNIRLENVEVSGYNLVGGLMARHYTSNIDGAQVVGCKITNLSSMPSLEPTETYYYSTGGLMGYHYTYDRTVKNATVRDTTITGPYNVGGVAGTAYQSGKLLLENVYVAEDVVVKSTGKNAGGVIGRGYLYDMTNVACGAQVSATGDAAGGIVGRAENGTNLIEPVLNMENVYFAGTVDAGNYAGGIIGLMNDRTYQFEPEELDGIVMTGSVRCAGDRASLWINSLASYNNPGNGTVMIWEDSTLNGQTAKAIQEGQETTKTDTFLCPELGQLVPGSSFGSQDFYKGLGFDGAKWDLAALEQEDNQYMPFLLDGSGNRLTDTDTYKEAPAGILLPEPGAQAESLVLYASGPDRFTIDLVDFTSQDESGKSLSVQFGEQEAATYTTDANGSITFTTDFETPVTVTVDEISTTFDAAALKDLCRNVMTWDGYWYYLDADSKIVYGDGKAKIGELSGLEAGDTPFHLWQGGILCKSSDGKYFVYTLTETDAGIAAGSRTEVVVDEHQVNTAPLYSYTYGENQQTPVQVFHEYSLFGGLRTEVRLFGLGSTPYVVSPRQDVVPDGVILSRISSITGDYTNYYGLLQTDGTLVDNRNNMQLNVPMDGIDQISNNFGYTGNVAVIRYNGDDNSTNVVVVDYTTGKVLHDTRTALTALLGYARSTLAGLFSVFGTGTGSSFLESEASLGSGIGQAQVPDPVGGDGLGGDSQDRYEGDIVLGTGDSSGQGDGTLSAGGPDGSGTALEGSGQAEESGTAPSVQEEEYQYIPGEGLYCDGVLTAREGEYQYQPGEGLYKNGVLLYAQTGQPTGEGQAVEVIPTEAAQAGASSAGGSASAVGSGTESGSHTGAQGSGMGNGDSQGIMALVQALGSQVVMYSQESGQYEAVDTARLLGPAEESATQQADLEEGMEQDTPEPAEEDTLTVNTPLGQTLTAQERSGFVLLGIITLTAAAALVLLAIQYYRHIERKRNGQ